MKKWQNRNIKDKKKRKKIVNCFSLLYAMHSKAASTFNKHMPCVWFTTSSAINSCLRCAMLNCWHYSVFYAMFHCRLHGFSSCRRLFHNLLNRNLFQVLQVKRSKTNSKMFSLEMKQQIEPRWNGIEYSEDFKKGMR